MSPISEGVLEIGSQFGQNKEVNYLHGVFRVVPVSFTCLRANHIRNEDTECLKSRNSESGGLQ